jgi:F-type H+-transporting ATPase subunit b
MEATLQALGGILLRAIPTVVLLLIVHFYLKWMFFRPLREVLAKRRAATQGMRESAEALLAKADEQTKSIEAKLRAVREEIYQEQEESRRSWVSEQTQRLEEARRQARELVHQSKLELENETAAAKRDLAATADSLADQIARSLLERRRV